MHSALLNHSALESAIHVTKAADKTIWYRLQAVLATFIASFKMGENLIGLHMKPGNRRLQLILPHPTSSFQYSDPIFSYFLQFSFLLGAW